MKKLVMHFKIALNVKEIDEKFKLWKIKNYFAFDNKSKAEKFENYLKTQSGRAFCKKR